MLVQPVTEREIQLDLATAYKLPLRSSSIRNKLVAADHDTTMMAPLPKSSNSRRFSINLDWLRAVDGASTWPQRIFTRGRAEAAAARAGTRPETSCFSGGAGEYERPRRTTYVGHTNGSSSCACLEYLSRLRPLHNARIALNKWGAVTGGHVWPPRDHRIRLNGVHI